MKKPGWPAAWILAGFLAQGGIQAADVPIHPTQKAGKNLKRTASHHNRELRDSLHNDTSLRTVPKQSPDLFEVLFPQYPENTHFEKIDDIYRSLTDLRLSEDWQTILVKVLWKNISWEPGRSPKFRLSLARLERLAIQSGYPRIRLLTARQYIDHCRNTRNSAHETCVCAFSGDESRQALLAASLVRIAGQAQDREVFLTALAGLIGALRSGGDDREGLSPTARVVEEKLPEVYGQLLKRRTLSGSGYAGDEVFRMDRIVRALETTLAQTGRPRNVQEAAGSILDRIAEMHENIL